MDLLDEEKTAHIVQFLNTFHHREVALEPLNSERRFWIILVLVDEEEIFGSVMLVRYYAAGIDSHH